MISETTTERLEINVPVPAPVEPKKVRREPSKGWWDSLKLDELWNYRELFYFLVWRDLKVRYKQTVLGASWAILQPLLTMVVFSVVFGRLAGIASDGSPYPIFSFAALVPWTFLANGLTHGSQNLVTASNMVRKVYFPRITMPTAAVLAGLADLGLAFPFLLGIALVYGYWPTATLLWLPVFLILALLTTIGAALWLAAFNVQFRDVRHAVPFLIQIWLFATPVAYPASLVPEHWRMAYAMNPMATVVEGFRWAVVGKATLSTGMITVSFLVAFLLLVTAVIYFRKMERTFADVI
ncbi:MAG TPA: ABC transporter permease [Acidobacteriota bacterium]|nr:ABC transporter permease [Acidobacteriota bacterium]